MKRFALFVCLVLIAGLVMAGTTFAYTVYSDPMNPGPTQWTGTGLWHQTGAGDTCWGGTGFWGYWIPANCMSYDTGAPNSGTLTGPSISIPASAVTTTLSVLNAYCGRTSPVTDQRIVQISVGGGPFTTLQQLTGDPWCMWNTANLDLSAYRGQSIQLRFLFDTVDANTGGQDIAWILDSVEVTAQDAYLTYTIPPTTFASVPYNWIEISGAGTSIFPGNTDDGGYVVPIGFNFNHLGQYYANIGVSSNGYLTFGNTLSAFSNADIPTASVPNDFIAPFWDDLYIYPTKPGGGGQVFYQTIGSAPNRQFIVQYNNVDFFSGQNNGKLYFEAILSEADQSVVFQYKDMLSVNAARGSGNSATIGVENSSGNLGGKFGFNLLNAVSDGLAIRLSIPDADADGLPDYVEIAYGTNPSDPTSPNVLADVDGDGLNWLQEYHAGTDPYIADSDNDGVSDGAEVAAGTNPLVPNNVQTTLVTFAGPGVQYGTAYFKFSVASLAPSTSGFRVYYGAASGSTAANYDAHFDITSRLATEGYIDQQWGMQGVPKVYFRVAPYAQINNVRFVGLLSNELSVYFSGSEPAKDGGNDVTPGVIGIKTTKSSDLSARCFIATAAYGSADASPVMLLRKFRDSYLLTNAPGRLFVETYYRLSPPIAVFVRDREWARIAVRGALLPAVGMSYLLVEASPMTRFLVFAFFLAVIAWTAATLMKRRRVKA